MVHRNSEKRISRGNTSLNILIALVVVFAIGIFYFHSSQGPMTMSGVAKAQLKAIQDGDISKAYALTTTTFQQQTPPETFASFIGGYPILQQYKEVSLTDNETAPNKGTVSGLMTSAEGRQLQIDYEFVKENENWRIQGLKLAPVGNNKIEVDATGMTVQAIMVSDVADPEGYVTKNKSVLDKLASRIFATVQVKAPKAGGKIEATVTQLSNGAKIGPSTDDISQAGNLLKAFAFTRVTNAWTPGDYEVTVKLSSGDTKSLKFQIK